MLCDSGTMSACQCVSTSVLLVVSVSEIFQYKTIGFFLPLFLNTLIKTDGTDNLWNI